jgi:hypothetical protein
MEALDQRRYAGGAVIFLIWVFSGISSIWLYTAARPRFGPGVKTAALTASPLGLTTVLWHRQAGVGLYPPRLLVNLALVCLLQSVVASVAGAWVYKE